MSEKETRRDLSRTFKTGTIGVSHALEKSGNKIDQLAKSISKSRMEQQNEQSDNINNEQSDSDYGVHTQSTDYVQQDIVDDDLIKTTASEDGLPITPLHEQTDAEISFDTGAAIKTVSNQNSGIKTAVSNNEMQGGRTATLQNEGVSANIIKTGISSDFADDSIEEIEESAESKTSHIKTGVKKALQLLNKKTFDFQAEQGKFSMAVTVAGKTGKAIGKTGKTVVRASDTLRRAVDNEDATGNEFIKGSAVRLARKTAGKKLNKLAGKGVSKMARAMFAVLKSAAKFLVGLLGSISSFAGILVAIMGAVALLTMVFGMTGSQSIVQKYEQYMVAVQESYDKQVDQWIASNPDGVVIGVRGDYGRIDWRVPLSIIQGTGAKLEYDSSEKLLLDNFDKAGLFEKHTETEQEITVVENDKEVIKKIKVLTITNAGYDEYMRWCNDSFYNIQAFMGMKGVYKNEQAFSSDQLQIIDSLNSSDSFFDMFSDAFKEHATTTGSNASEKNFNSPEYNGLNIFTQAGYKGQCTWYAYGRVLKLTGKRMPSGDAQTWLNSAIAMGYPTGTRPSKNAVVVLSGGSFGHVAFVEAWDGTSLTVSEGNYNNPYANTNMMVEYARNHAVELVHEQRYPDYNAYRETQAKNGLTIVGFIYLE